MQLQQMYGQEQLATTAASPAAVPATVVQSKRYRVGSGDSIGGGCGGTGGSPISSPPLRAAGTTARSPPSHLHRLPPGVLAQLEVHLSSFPAPIAADTTSLQEPRLLLKLQICQGHQEAVVVPVTDMVGCGLPAGLATQDRQAAVAQETKDNLSKYIAGNLAGSAATAGRKLRRYVYRGVQTDEPPLPPSSAVVGRGAATAREPSPQQAVVRMEDARWAAFRQQLEAGSGGGGNDRLGTASAAPRAEPDLAHIGGWLRGTSSPLATLAVATGKEDEGPQAMPKLSLPPPLVFPDWRVAGARFTGSRGSNMAAPPRSLPLPAVATHSPELPEQEKSLHAFGGVAAASSWESQDHAAAWHSSDGGGGGGGGGGSGSVSATGSPPDERGKRLSTTSGTGVYAGGTTGSSSKPMHPRSIDQALTPALQFHGGNLHVPCSMAERRRREKIGSRLKKLVEAMPTEEVAGKDTAETLLEAVKYIERLKRKVLELQQNWDDDRGGGNGSAGDREGGGRGGGGDDAGPSAGPGAADFFQH
eukprot:SM000041S15496  [mRNA]  locus=s41:393806:396134:- [translate_table: standard]